MTTFTMQDLTPQQQTALDDQALQDMAKLGGADWAQMGKDLANHELAHQHAQQARLDAIPPQHAPEPQPTLCESTQTDIPTIINTICTQLQLLSTVIRGEQARGNSQAEDQSLQETIALTLQQADWFRDMVRHELVGLDIESIAQDAVESVVENEVESYFDNRFDPSDHFDFGDAVQDAVSDQIDDVVRDRVMDSLEEVVAEKLSEANVSISF